MSPTNLVKKYSQDAVDNPRIPQQDIEIKLIALEDIINSIGGKIVSLTWR